MAGAIADEEDEEKRDDDEEGVVEEDGKARDEAEWVVGIDRLGDLSRDLERERSLCLKRSSFRGSFSKT